MSVHGEHPPIEQLQANLWGATQCGEAHPLLSATVCDRWGEHSVHEGMHSASHTRLTWMPEKGFSARASDPISSHEAAERDFDIEQTARGLRREILHILAAEDRWFTCRELIELIYGPGPYTYEQAVSLNKVQTVALGLHRDRYLLRLDPEAGELVRYRAHPDLLIDDDADR